ncbi:hypothetical protein EDB84DRAFT_695390 [Lactarius hengduanensis]|nr:hypothetical protein EDB84DRAFT_695390 [Lactarius hengduanensis]
MSAQAKPLVGSVFERQPRSSVSAPSTPKSVGSNKGFPMAQHRSESVFARSRKAPQQPGAQLLRATEPPVVQPAPIMQKYTPSEGSEDNDWRAQISEENERRVAAMTEHEREEERREIEEIFGKNIGEVLQRARRAREANQGQTKPATSLERDLARGLPDDGAIAQPEPPTLRVVPVGERAAEPSSPLSIVSGASTRPSTPARANRKLRFAEVTPDDVHVYESAPPSPRRKPLALPPSSSDDSAVSLGQWKGPFPKSLSPSQPPSEPPSLEKVTPSSVVSGLTPEEGTPEDIRRRFFPSLPSGDPSLAWIEATPLLDPAASTLRFDLRGAPIPPQLSVTLPTHLGLHHHAEGARAGYTIDDVFLLARSTVPAQRVVMFGVMAGITRRLAVLRRGISEDTEGMEELRGKEEDLRKRAVAAGAEAMGESGSLGSRAVEVLWEALVGWDSDLMSVDGVELQEDIPEKGTPDQEGESVAKGDAISSLPLDFFLTQVATIFGAAYLPHLSLLQLLAILQRLAMHNNAIADTITDTPFLIASLLRLFILTPIPPLTNSPPPVPDAIRLMITLTSASRLSASKLLDPASALLRFLISSPTSSPYPLPLATSLLTHTLQLYTTFARYGLHAHTATIAAEPLTSLASHILSPECDSRPLLTAYITLLGAWTICASDPHQTTPPHEILWSQISGWGWISNLPIIARKFTQEPADWGSWTTLWNAEAAWLEGARHNGVRGGVEERESSLARLKPAFARDTETEVISGAISSLKRLLSEIPAGYDVNRGLAFYREVMESALLLSAVIRLWLACLPPDNTPLPEPPFQLPFSLLGMLAAFISTHPLLSESSGVPSHMRPFLRPLVSYVSNYVWLSGRLPTTKSDLLLTQLGVALVRFLPGDEDAALDMLDAIINLVDQRYLSNCGWSVPSEMWSRGGLHVLKPFLTFDLVSRQDDVGVEGEKAPRVRVAPLIPTSRSLRLVTTQRLPSTRGFGFLFARDWSFLPLDHLLRSGTSPVWQCLPSGWDANETEVVRATLILARVVREAFLANGTPPFAMTRAEVTFNCMKVFMLEHGQAQGAPSASGENREEVFRDETVGELMKALLLPCTLGASPNGLSASAASDEQDDLELAASRFLGTGIPFFQFYTDLVALYDAVSFGHPLFAALLLPPLAQRYAPDYRKLVYDETAHVLGTVRTPVELVIGGAAGTFLWPAEQAPEVVGAQLSLLVGRRARVPIEGFVYWMAVHHVAANIWPDLREDPPSAIADERGRKLLEALVIQGEHTVVREVTLYWQRRKGTVALPPVCFVLDPIGQRNRLDWVESWARGDFVERIEGLLNAV